MAISDLVRFHIQSSSLSQEAEPKPPSLRRFEFIVKSLVKNGVKGPGASSRHKQMMRIVEMIFDEAVEELTDKNVTDEFMSGWVFWFGKLMEWCATGDLTGLPEDMQEIVADYSAVVQSTVIE